MKLNAICAVCDENLGIGKGNSLPWSVPDDFDYFMRVIQTTRDRAKMNAIIMGRLTWLSNPIEYQPFDRCLNIIISGRMSLDELKLKPNANRSLVLIFASIREAIEHVSTRLPALVEDIFFLGGNQIYQDAVKLPSFNRFYLTRVYGNFHCDVFLQPAAFLNVNFKLLSDRELDCERQLYKCEYNTLLTDSRTGVKFKFECYQKS